MAGPRFSILCDVLRFFASHVEPAVANGPALSRRTGQTGHADDLEFHRRRTGKTILTRRVAKSHPVGR